MLDHEDLAARFIELDVRTQQALLECFTGDEIAALLLAMRLNYR